MSVTINGTNGLTFNDNSTQTTAATGFGFKNRIINGAMVIDQRNAGASVSASGSYPVDRFVISNGVTSWTAQRSTVVPAGFINSLLYTSVTGGAAGTNDRLIIRQRIEGFNWFDLGWGSASAQTVTLSFKVRSSLTGTFSGSLRNSNEDRSYPFSFTISAANTFEDKSITIPGDTTGTWETGNGTAVQLSFDMGSGSGKRTTAGAWAAGDFVGVTGAVSVSATTGATFYITGVQLEKGSTATSFDYRPYGTELALCQRYYTKSFNPDTATSNGNSATTFSTYNGIYTSPIDRPSTGGPGAANDSTTSGSGTYGAPIRFPAAMRSSPTMTYYGNSSGAWWVQGVGSGGAQWYAIGSTISSYSGFTPTFASPISTDSIGMVFGHWAASAEL